jgi:hypothetical protein
MEALACKFPLELPEGKGPVYFYVPADGPSEIVWNGYDRKGTLYL